MTQKTPISDVIVVIPGISGSVLERAGHVVWDKSWRTARKLLMADERFLQSLTLDNTSPPEGSEPMTATGLIPGPSIIPGLERLGGYSRIANWLNQTFALVRDTPRGVAPPNYFEFAYDWRLDNRENARLLARFVGPRLQAWRNHSGVRDARVIIFAHSMGGLVARYYTEVLEGWRNCRLLVTLGTPHRGAAGALQALMSGYRGLPARVTETLRTFPSVYQLLPRYDFIEDERTSGLSRTHTGPSLPGVDQAQAAAAHDFHLEIQRAARANSMHDEYHSVYQVIPVIGTHQSTPQKLVITRDAYTMSSGPLSGMPAALADGDGTVPRVSAIPLEQSDRDWQIFIPERHSALASSRYSLTAVCEPIRHMRALGGVVREYRDPNPRTDQPVFPVIRAEIPDVIYRDDIGYVEAVMDGEPSPDKRVVARVSNADSGREVLVAPLAAIEGVWRLELKNLPEGLYEIALEVQPRHSTGSAAVHDVFAVVARD